MNTTMNTTTKTTTKTTPALWADLRNPRLGDLPQTAVWGAVGSPAQDLLDLPPGGGEVKCENPF